ncbi:MAG TPA: M20/M25/M40 family metallo-hydrolase [Verrucomicrobiae bacterium]|nr:M20/M25/M40 family metallo-hydrolase [Verrucomicrobiae bacterium]
MENRLSGWVIFLFVLIVAGVCAADKGTPDPLAATASQEAFSAERALVYLNAFASAPHPIGSPEHDRVRDYLVSQLTGLGLHPEVQRTTGVTPRYEVAGTVENIVARLKGTSGTTDAVALVAHYDSVPAGPGAGDDGAGVAALIETLRALRAGPALRNDILFVITDGEEDGLLGASAFVAENPAAKDVRVVVNFEARGNAGESQMFETSAGNGGLVRIFAGAAPHPSGSSLTYEIYKRMPNDTDMTVFRKSGAAGLNFAFIGHWEAYHTPLDNPQLLDRGSLQQQGENALSLARRFGNTDLTQLQDRDSVYFSIPGNFFAHYSSRFVWPLAIVCGVLLFGVIFYANGAWQTSVLAIFGSFFAHILALLVLLLIGLGFEFGVRWLHLHALSEGGLDQNTYYTLGLFALLLAVDALLYKFFRKRITPPAFFLGGAALLFVLVLVTSKWLAGGSYTFAWPLLAGLLATAIAAFRPGDLSILSALLLSALSLPALLLFVPLLKGFYAALGFTTIGAPLLSVTFGLLFLMLFPFLDKVLESAGKLLPIAALVAALALCVVAAKITRYSAAHPKPSLLSYALDADSGRALWTSSASRVDAWTAQYLGASASRGKLPDFIPDWYPIDFLQHEAPSIALVPPLAELLEDSSDGATRTLHLRITTPRHARTLHVGIRQVEVLSASVNGQDLGKPSEARWRQPGHWAFDYANPPAEGIDLLLSVQASGPVTVVLVDRSSGLPTIPGATFPTRPADSMPIHTGDQTMVRRSFVF